MLPRYRNYQGSSIVSDETTEYLPPERCRICLKKGEIPIFGQDDISEDVMEFGAVEISEEDSFPQNLCEACNSLLEAAILFRNTARKSDEILKNSYYQEDTSVLSEETDYKNEDQLYDTDNESTIKREYLEYNYSSSESDLGWKSEPEIDDISITNVSQAESQATIGNKDSEMPLLKVKEDEYDSNDIDNELVMIIVSDEDKPNKSSFSCTKCNIAFESSNELEKHDQEQHGSIIDDQIKCDICSELVDKRNFKMHVKEHRDKYKEKHRKKYGKVECEVCHKKVNKSYFKYHMKMHGTAEEQAERLVECTMCNKVFSAHYFSDHMKRVHDKIQTGGRQDKNADKESSKHQKSICPVCDKKVSKANYKIHLAKHGAPTRRYICDKCGKVFKYASAFKTHTLTHSSELKFQCQFCPYRGSHLALLKIHVRTHTGDYNYKCTECPARFITKSNLSKHLHRHRGVCNFKCETCNKGFYSKRDVDKHVKTVHLELKNNVCEICGKGYGHRDNLLSHQLKVHKREKITERRGRIPTYLKKEMNIA